MSTLRLPLSEASIQRAAALLVNGGLVAFPTETVYGLGARADQSAAVARIFKAKGRPSGNPLIVHVASVEAAAALTSDWNTLAAALAAAFWPGPLTLVLARAPGAVADEVTAHGPTVAVRVPRHPVTLALLRAANVPVAAPSANRSTTVSPTTAAHVLKTLDGAIDAVLDAGPTGFGMESTIVDVSGGPTFDAPPVMRLLRHGAVPAMALAAFGTVLDLASETTSETARSAAPGRHAKHYSPRAKVLLVPPPTVLAVASAERAQGRRVGTITFADSSSEPLFGSIVSSDLAIELSPFAEGYARDLYAALHALDDAACDVIVIAEPHPHDPAWAAVRDRLRRAASP